MHAAKHANALAAAADAEDATEKSTVTPGPLAPARELYGAMLPDRSMPALALAALCAACAARQPAPGCIHHSDRGSQYASEDYRAELAKHGLRGSMGRRGNPYDNAKAESLMKTLKVEEVYLMECETFDDVASAAPQYLATTGPPQLNR